MKLDWKLIVGILGLIIAIIPIILTFYFHIPKGPVLEFSTGHETPLIHNENLMQFFLRDDNTYVLSDSLYLEIKVENKGGRDAKQIRYELTDENRRFTMTDSLLEVNTHDPMILIFHPKVAQCAALLPIKSKESYERALQEECNRATIEGGLSKWILKVMITGEEPVCYSFNTCIIDENVSEAWCREQLDEPQQLAKDNCP